MDSMDEIDDLSRDTCRSRRAASLVTVNVNSIVHTSLATTPAETYPTRSDLNFIRIEDEEMPHSNSVNAALGALTPMKDIKEERATIQIYFDVLTYLGAHPYKYCKEKGKVVWMKMVPSVIVSLLIITQTIFEIQKINLYATAITGSNDVADYIALGKWITEVSVRGAFLVSCYTNFDEYVQFLDLLGKSIYFMKTFGKKNKYISICLLLHSLTSAICFVAYAVPDKPQNVTTLEWKLQFHCRDYYLPLQKNNWDEYVKESLAEPEPCYVGCAICGSIAVISKFYSYAVQHFSKDVVLIMAITLYQFACSLQKCTVQNATFIDYYYDLKKISKVGNKALNTLFAITLLDNLLQLSHFYNRSMNPTATHNEKIVLLLNILKMVITLGFGERIANKMDQIKDFIEDAGQMKLNEVNEDLKHIYEDICRGSISIGRGTLSINKGFLISYVGVSIGYFLSIVETRDLSK